METGSRIALPVSSLPPLFPPTAVSPRLGWPGRCVCRKLLASHPWGPPCSQVPPPHHWLPYCLPVLVPVPTTESESSAGEDGSLCFRAGRKGEKRDSPFLLLPLSTLTNLSDKLSVSLEGTFSLKGLRYCSWGRWREEGFEEGMASGVIP